MVRLKGYVYSKLFIYTAKQFLKRDLIHESTSDLHTNLYLQKTERYFMLVGMIFRVRQAVVTRLSIVGRGGDIATTSGPVDMSVGAFGILVVGVFWLDLESMGTEVVTLSLEQVGGQVLGSVAIEEGKGSGEGWHWDAPLDGLGNNVSPAWLGRVNGLVEEIVEEQVLEVWVLTISVGDVLQEDRSDDAATSPHEGDGGLIQLPFVFLGGSLHQHETLGVGDDLGSVESLFEVAKEFLPVARE